jgi:hypothetical protein
MNLFLRRHIKRLINECDQEEELINKLVCFITKSTMFSMESEVVLELRSQYFKRGGTCPITTESVKEIFE